jgi:hypothetical protein
VFVSVPAERCWSCFKTADATAMSSSSSSWIEWVEEQSAAEAEDFLLPYVQFSSCGPNVPWWIGDWSEFCCMKGRFSYDSKLGKRLPLFLETYAGW